LTEHDPVVAETPTPVGAAGACAKAACPHPSNATIETAFVELNGHLDPFAQPARNTDIVISLIRGIGLGIRSVKSTLSGGRRASRRPAWEIRIVCCFRITLTAKTIIYSELTYRRHTIEQRGLFGSEAAGFFQSSALPQFSPETFVTISGIWYKSHKNRPDDKQKTRTMPRSTEYRPTTQEYLQYTTVNFCDGSAL
jgi:hypothetical protein